MLKDLKTILGFRVGGGSDFTIVSQRQNMRDFFLQGFLNKRYNRMCKSSFYYNTILSFLIHSHRGIWIFTLRKSKVPLNHLPIMFNFCSPDVPFIHAFLNCRRVYMCCIFFIINKFYIQRSKIFRILNCFGSIISDRKTSIQNQKFPKSHENDFFLPGKLSTDSL